ncbi:MAG TPA: hypothetical protein VGB64_08025 [Actinomycetota bacterium]
MRIRELGFVVAALSVTAPLPPAFGTFATAPSPPAMSVSSATLAAPASASAVNASCVPGVSRSVSVSWSQTTSTFADGYIVLRATAAGGPYSSVATIASATVVTWADLNVAASTTYYYRVQTTKLAWRSADSPTASVTTPSLLCVL